MQCLSCLVALYRNLKYNMYNSQYIDSPMEMSIVDGEERPTNINEVSDYATEIHTHLREMEVRIWKLNVACQF